MVTNLRREFMKKAQSMIEVSLILFLVVAVSLVVWPLINNQKTKLANLSKTSINSQSSAVEATGASANNITLPSDDSSNSSSSTSVSGVDLIGKNAGQKNYHTNP
jgi:uncharacterized protein (UPF0333 family)